MADDEEIDRGEIAMRFLSQAPPLQFPPVLDDVKNIIGDDALMDAIVPQARKAYNLEQMTIVDTPAGGKVLLTEFAECGTNEYLDPAEGKVFTVDHVKKSVEGERDATPDEMGSALGPTREACQAAVQSYVKTNFAPSVISATYAKAGKIVICISGAEFDQGNMWSGRWRSTWNCAIDGDSITLSGDFKVHVHFYEDGNVQAVSTHSVEEVVSAGSESETAEAIVDLIKTQEGKYQAMLDGAYVNLKQDHSIMNALRRPLPMDKRQIDFKTLAIAGKMYAGLK